LTFDIALSILTFFTEMIQEGKATSSCFVLAAIPAKKQIVQASQAIIVTDMIRMGFRTGLFFSNGFETEISPASIAELKRVSIQNCAADLTNMGLHAFALEDRGKRYEVKPFPPVSRWPPFPSSLLPHSNPTVQTS
jgi:hypothetical protein